MMVTPTAGGLLKQPDKQKQLTKWSGISGDH